MRIFLIFIYFVFQFFIPGFASQVNINLDFFKKFNDDCLVKYIYQTLENNHKIKETDAKAEGYKYEIKKALADEFPDISTGANYLGTHFPTGDSNFFVKKNSFILPFIVNWEADLLLKNKDKIKSKDYIYKAELACKKGVYLSLLSDVASSYINILMYDYLIKKQENILKNQERKLAFENKKLKFGISDIFSLNKEKENLKTEEEYFENLIKNQKTMLYNFSELIGESAANYNEIERGTIEKIEYAENIPDIINSDLIYSRPDMIEAENRLKSAKIDITVAKKEFFPKFNIAGLLFFDTAGGNFFNWDSSFAFLLAGLTQDLFAGGRKVTKLKIKKAKYKELFEKYKQIDLIAIKEVYNAINLIRKDTAIEEKTKEKLAIEKNNLKLSKSKLNQGIISDSDYINHEINLNQKEQIFANAKTTKLIDYITLYKALGGEL